MHGSGAAEDRTVSVVSHAQHGEDLQIAYFLGNAKRQSYIDVGSLWPQKLSNSYYFYERQGFGLCIDPNPEVAADYARVRPRDTFLNVGISSAPGTLTYNMYENPVFNTFSAERAALVLKKSRSRGGRGLVDAVDIDVVTLDDAVTRTGFADRCDGRLDFLTVDVEGLELEVVRGFSFSILRPRLVVLEHIRRRSADVTAEHSDLCRAMTDRGYWLAGYTGHDMYFLDNRS
jgi:FkbM family methyltransferase